MGAIFMSVWYKLAGDGTHKLPVSGQALYHETVALVTQGGGQLNQVICRLGPLPPSLTVCSQRTP